MAKKLTAAEWAAFSNYVQTADHHEIYKLHMAQARQTRKMFADDPAMLAKIDVISQKIKDTYKQACLEAAE
jgi:hypothetical protein